MGNTLWPCPRCRGFCSIYTLCAVHVQRLERSLHCTSFTLTLLVLWVTYGEAVKAARFHCMRMDIITIQTLLVLEDVHPRRFTEQKRRRQRATKKVCIFIGSLVFCVTPYIITRLAELSPPVQISPYWGVISKSLVYSKATVDSFVYSLLQQEYRKALSGMTTTLKGCKLSFS